MILNRRLIAAALGLAVALAACGGASTASTAPASAGASQAPAATQAPASSEEATAETPTDAATSGSGETATEDPATLNDLAKLIPSSVNGVQYTRAGYNGDQLGALGAAAGISSDKLAPILQANGKTISDVNFAIATPADSSSTSGGMIYALQLEGVDATTWMSAMNVDQTSMPKTTIGDKTVYGTGAAGFGFYAYPTGDKLFLVLLADDATAKAIIAALP